VFRTFDNNADNLIFEWNQFCSGEHPAFNGRNNMPMVKFDGSKNCKELRMRAVEQQAMIYRQDS